METSNLHDMANKKDWRDYLGFLCGESYSDEEATSVITGIIDKCVIVEREKILKLLRREYRLVTTTLERMLLDKLIRKLEK